MEDTLNAITDRIKTTEDAFQLLIKTATEYSDVDFSKKTKENSEALEELHEKIKNAKLGLDTLIENNSKVFTKKQLNDLKSYSNALEKYLKDPLHQNGGKSKITDHLINREDLIKTTSALHDGTVKIEQYGNEIKKVDKSNEELVNSNEDVKKSFEENLDPINENINAYTKIGDIKTFVNLASGIGQLASALNSLKNIGNIWNNEDLTTGEKILQIITALGTGLAMLGNSFKLVKDSLTSIGGMMKKAAVDYMLHEAEAKKLAIAEAEAAAAKEASAAASATEGAAEEAEAVVKEESAAASTHLTLAEAQEAAMDGTLTAANIPLTASFYGLAGAI